MAQSEVPVTKKDRDCGNCIFQDKGDDGHRWNYYCNAKEYGMEGMPVPSCASACPVFRQILDAHQKWETLTALRDARIEKERKIVRKFLQSPKLEEALDFLYNVAQNVLGQNLREVLTAMKTLTQ